MVLQDPAQDPETFCRILPGCYQDPVVGSCQDPGRDFLPGKRISNSKSSRRRDVYVSPYQQKSSSDEEYISDTSVRRKKMPKSKKYVRERKKDQELEKTESEDTDSITEDKKTGQRRSRSQQRRRDKGKNTKPKIVSSKLTYRKKYSKSKTKSYLTSSASSGSSSSETKCPVKKFIKEKMFTKSNKSRSSVSDKYSDYRNLNSSSGTSSRANEAKPDDTRENIVAALLAIPPEDIKYPILFDPSEPWEKFFEKVKDCVKDKTFSFTLSYIWQGANVSLTKDSWGAFTHYNQHTMLKPH